MDGSVFLGSTPPLSYGVSFALDFTPHHRLGGLPNGHNDDFIRELEFALRTRLAQVIIDLKPELAHQRRHLTEAPRFGLDLLGRFHTEGGIYLWYHSWVFGLEFANQVSYGFYRSLKASPIEIAIGDMRLFVHFYGFGLRQPTF